MEKLFAGDRDFFYRGGPEHVACFYRLCQDSARNSFLMDRTLINFFLFLNPIHDLAKKAFIKLQPAYSAADIATKLGIL